MQQGFILCTSEREIPAIRVVQNIMDSLVWEWVEA